MSDELKEQDLVDALLECSNMKDPQRRRLVLDALPDEIKNNIVPNNDHQVHVYNIVTTCLDYRDGIEQLIKRLERREGNSIGMQRVIEIWSQFPKPRPPVPLPKVTEHADHDLAIGQEIHWDRDMVVETFVGMIKNPQYSWRVLAIQGPKDAGLDSLVTRLEQICKDANTGERRLLHAKVHLQGIASGADFAVKTLNLLSRMAENSQHQIVRSQCAILETECDEIALGGAPGSALGGQRIGLSPRQVAKKLTNCLKQASQNCTVALLLQGLERVGTNQMRKWLMDWLTEYARHEQGLVIVITGETGLQDLVGRESDKILCFPSLPLMTWQDFANWARVGYKFKWFTDEMAREIHGYVHGSITRFQGYLELRKKESELGSETKETTP